MSNKSRTVTFKQNKSDSDAPRPNRRSEQLGFMQLPRPILYRKGLSPAAKLIAEWLYDHLSPGTHKATGSHETIMADMEFSKPTIIKALKELFQKGIIMGVKKAQNSSGGFFNVYTMRQFDLVKERDAGKLLKVVKTQEHTKPVIQNSKPKPDIEKTQTSTCQTCQGTGWGYNREQRASFPCPDCKKQHSRGKNHS